MAIWQDIRYALRGIRANPAFSIAAIGIMGLGIGANTAMFSVVQAVLLRPLPYARPDRIVQVMRVRRDTPEESQAGGLLAFLRDHYRSFETVAAAGGGSSGLNLAVGDTAAYIRTLPVSAGYFEVFESAPQMGRSFTQVEELPNAAPAVVLSYALWQGRLGGDPKIVGSPVSLGGRSYTVIGVMPPLFESFPAVDAWTPIRTNADDNGLNYAMYGRLRNSASLAQAESEVEALVPAIQRAHEDFVYKATLRLAPFQEALTREARSGLMVLLAAVAVVLSIACANVAGLLLARAARRRREIATRTALGATRRRIAAQLLTESTILSAFGGAVGLLMALWFVASLTTAIPAEYTLHRQIHIDGAVLLAAVGVSLLTGLLFGLAPALQATRFELVDALKQGAGATGGRAWTGRALVVVQIALGMVLLIGAGLLIRTFANLRGVHPGFDPRGIVTAQMSVQGPAYQNHTTLIPFYESVLERVRQSPGVEAAAVSNNLPLVTYLNVGATVPDGSTPEIFSCDWRYVSPDYFQVLRIPLLAGRLLADSDGEKSAPVAIVNQAFANKYFAGRDAVGRHVSVLGDSPRTVAGVIGDIRDHSLARPSVPAIYVPIRQTNDRLFRQAHHFYPVEWLIRTRSAADPNAAGALRDAVRAFDPKLPLSSIRTMDEVIGNSISSQRFRMLLLGVFAAFALILAAAGIYGLISYSVAQRTKEIGIRMALGASAADTLGEIVKTAVWLAAAGVLVGSFASFFATRLLTRFIYGVAANDPLTYAVVTGSLLAVAIAASIPPAMRAARIDPMTSLRTD
jgi:putative ABC transport system permease protein